MFEQFFKGKKNKDDEFIEKEIERIENEMTVTELTSDEYGRLKDNLADWIDVKRKPKTSIDPNTVLKCICEIGGILIIVGYEYGHVLASKALNRVSRM